MAQTRIRPMLSALEREAACAALKAQFVFGFVLGCASAAAVALVAAAAAMLAG